MYCVKKGIELRENANFINHCFENQNWIQFAAKKALSRADTFNADLHLQCM